MIVLAYLLAIVAANLILAEFGPAALVFNAFWLIGFDLVARDRIHDRLGRRVLLVVAVGGGVTYLAGLGLGVGTARIAVASTLAFLLASLTDTAAYVALRRRPWLERANGSNVPAAVIDSIVFPLAAFGVLVPGIVAGQTLSKIGGGIVWSLAIYAWRRR